MQPLKKEHFPTADDVEPWPVWRLWPGKTVVVIGAGPSLDLQQTAAIWRAHVLGRVKVVAVNTSFQAAPWADLMHACDHKFFKWHEKTIWPKQGSFGFMGMKVTCDKQAAEDWPRLRWIPGIDGPGLSTDPSVIHYGKNSGYQAVNIAYLMGAAKILLVGFDHQFRGNLTVGLSGNDSHWHGEHPDKVRSWYERWLPGWQQVADQLPDIGLEIVNCTPDSALRVFKMGKLKNELK